MRVCPSAREQATFPTPLGSAREPKSSGACVVVTASDRPFGQPVGPLCRTSTATKHSANVDVLGRLLPLSWLVVIATVSLLPVYLLAGAQLYHWTEWWVPATLIAYLASVIYPTRKLTLAPRRTQCFSSHARDFSGRTRLTPHAKVRASAAARHPICPPTRSFIASEIARAERGATQTTR